MGTENFLRVGIDGTEAQSGERVVNRSLDAIMLGVDKAAAKFDNLDRKIASTGQKSAPDAANTVKRSMADITESVQVAGVSVSDLENMFVRLAARTVMVAGIYKSVGAIKSAVVESLQYLGQIETAGLSISASFLSGGEYIDKTTQAALKGTAALRAAQQDSANVIEQLRVANFKTSATLDQLIYAYQVTLPEAQAKAFNRKQIMDYTLAMVQAAGAIGMPYNQIGEETRDMLKGAVNSRNTRIATILGMNAQNQEYMKAVKQGGDALYDYLMKRLEGFRIAGIETQKTWAGLWSNVKDIAKMGGAEAVGPLFESIKKTLKEIADYVITIDEKTGTITINPEFKREAKDIAETLNGLFHNVVDGTKFLLQHREAIMNVAEAYLIYRTAAMASLLANKAIESDFGKSTILASRVAQNALNPDAGAMLINGPKADLLRSKGKLDGANETLAAAQAQRDYVKATQDAMKVDKDFATSRAANIQATLSQVESDVKSKIVKAESITMRIAEKQAILENTRAKMSELAADTLQMNSPYAALRENAVIAEKQFFKVKAEESNIRRSVTMLQKQENAALSTLADSIVAQVPLTEKLSKAKSIQVVTEQRFVAAVDQTTTAQKILTEAQREAQIAADAYAAAQARTTIGARALALAGGIVETTFKAIGTAAHFAFGTIEGLVIVVGSLYWALDKLYHRQDDRASALAKIGQGGDFAALVEDERKIKNEIKKLKEQDMTPQQRESSTLKDFDTNLKSYIDKEAALKASIKELEGFGIWKGMRDNDGLYPVERKKAELRNVQDMIRNGRQQLQENLKLQSERDALSEYKGKKPETPKDDKTAAELLRVQKEIMDAWLGLDKSFTDRRLQEEKNRTKLLVGEVSNQHSLQLISEQQFIDRKARMNDNVLASELNILNERKQKILNKLFEKTGISESEAMKKMAEPNISILDVGKDADKNNRNINSLNVTQVKTEIELRTKLQEVMKEINNLETARSTDSENQTFATRRHVKELAQSYVDLGAAIKASRGDTTGSVIDIEAYKRRMLNKQISDAMANDNGIDNSDVIVKEVESLFQQIEQSSIRTAHSIYEQLKHETELKAQLLESAGAMGTAARLRDSILPLDPARLGLPPAIKAFDELIKKLNEVAKAFEQLHRNDASKFKFEDMGVDQFTKRERDIQRQFELTKEKKIGELRTILESETGTAEQIRAIQEDLAANDQSKTADLYTLKKEMVMTYATTAADLMGQLAGSMDQNNESQFKAAKALSSAQVIVSTGVAIMRAYSDLGPIAGTAAAIAMAAIGAAQLAKIASTSYKGGGSIGGVSAGFSGGGGSAGVDGKAGINTGVVGGGSVGSKIGGSLQTTESRATFQQLQRIADSSENASIALTKVSESMVNIADMFKSGTAGGLLAGTLTSPSTGYKSDNGFDKMVTLGGLTGGILSSGITSLLIGGLTAGLGALGNAMFGWGNTWQTKDYGIKMGLNSGQFSGETYRNDKKEGGWFTSDKNRTILGELNDQLNSAFTKNIKDIENTVNRSAAILGTSVDLSKVNLPSANIQTSGRTTEEIQKDLTTWFSKAADIIGQNVSGLKDYAYYGESAYDSLIRLTTALQGVNEKLQLTGHSLINSTLAGGNQASKLAEAAGGVDKLNKLQDDYFSKLYTKTEQSHLKQLDGERQVAVGIREMNAANDGLNWAIPKTNEQFRKLVDGLDLNTDKGAALYLSLMKLAPAMSDATTAATDLADSVKKFTTDLQDRTYTAQGLTYTEKMYKLQITQEQEMLDAQKNGYDLIKLAQVQQLEKARAIADVFKQALNDTLSIKINLLQGLTGIIKSTLSPQDSYFNAKGTYEVVKALAQSGDKKALQDIVSKANDLLTASGNYNASNAQFQSDKADIVATLSNLVGLTSSDPSLEVVQKQLDTLNSIQTALADGNDKQLAALLNVVGNTGDISKYLSGYLKNSPGGTQTAADAIDGGVTNTTTPNAPAAPAPVQPSQAELAATWYYKSKTPDLFRGMGSLKYGSTIYDIIGFNGNWTQNLLQNANTGKTGIVANGQIPSFAIGTSGLSADGLLYGHKGEIIIDPQSSNILQRYGISVNGTADSYSMEETNRRLEASIRVQQEGFSRMIELTEKLVVNSNEQTRKMRQGE
jgi:hypothetical protein